MAEVWRASDPFGNDVAIKMLIAGEGANEDQIKRFLREAELMRNLDHRNICRIFEVGIYEKVHYLAIEFLKGVPLDRLIAGGPTEGETTIDEIVSRVEKSLAVDRKAAPAFNPADPPPQVKPLREQHALALIQGILNGVQFAHEHGIIHRDLKPSNIMIKRNGDPVIMDFGLGRFESSQHSMTMGSQMVGTIEFMAPEQARSAVLADERSDVFSAGAILYFLLTGRKWFLSSGNILLDSARLIEQEVVPPRRIQSHISRDLETIVLKALEKEPERRYASARAFLEDLNRYQRDEPIAARPANLGYRMAVKIRKHRTPFFAGAAALVVGSILGIVLFGEKLKEYASWGRPILIEHFSDSTWQEQWVVQKGRFEAKNGRLVTQQGAGDHFSILYRRELFGSVALEFEGEMLPDHQPGDLSIRWADDIQQHWRGYDFQTGSLDNQFYQIGELSTGAELARVRRENKPGTIYRVRAEIEGGHLRLVVNGRKVLEYHDYFPVSSGFIGLFGYYPGKAFDNVKIYSKEVAERVPVLAIGDNYYLHERYVDAKREYGLVVRSHASGSTGKQALFKKGLACFQLGELDEARAISKLLIKGPLRIDAGLLLCEVLSAKGEHDSVVATFKDLCRTADSREMPLLKKRLASLVARTARLAPNMRNEDAEKYVRLFIRLFPDDQDCPSVVAAALNRLGYADEVLREYPAEHNECAQALSSLGRYEELISRYPQMKWSVASALIMQNRADEVLRRFPGEEQICARALTFQGRFEKVLREYPFYAKGVLVAQQRYEEALSYPQRDWYMAAALVELGRIEEFLAIWRKRTDGDEIYGQVMHLQAFNAFIRGEAGPDTLERLPYMHTSTAHFAHFILPGFLRFLKNGADLESEYAPIFREKRFAFSQQLWYAASFICGQINDKEFRSQPVQLWLDPHLAFYSAMRSEIRNDAAGALAGYRAFMAIPRWRRPLELVMKRFAEWRIEVLSQQNRK